MWSEIVIPTFHATDMEIMYILLGIMIGIFVQGFLIHIVCGGRLNFIGIDNCNRCHCWFFRFGFMKGLCKKCHNELK